MNQSACMTQVGRLFAAFPSSKASESTATVYVETLVALQYEEALRDAVDELVASERWLPTISLVRETYTRHRDKYLPPALAPVEMSDSERALQAKRWAAMTAHAASRGSSGHGDAFDECEHADCKAVR